MNKLLTLLFIVVTFSVAGYSQTYNYDVTGDGSVTTADVTAIYDYLLGNVSSVDQRDVNGDGVVTVADVTAIYDYLLGNVPSDEHESVDLGLPSGTLWAKMNLGANKPEDYGKYFAWGETTHKNVYNWSTYVWCKGSGTTLTKYCTYSYYGNNGFVDNKTELDPEDDAATVNWGAEWRMPSKEQLQELLDNCTTRWTTRNGVNGYLFTSKINGVSLFLPATGSRNEGTLDSAGVNGCYWSRTIYTSGPNYACSLRFGSTNVDWFNSTRYRGFTVRPVRVA